MTVRFETLPLSTNALHSVYQGRKILSAKGRANKEAIGWEARSQYRGQPLSGRLAVEVSLFWPNNRNHDVDNIKTLLDSCTGILWTDDGLIDDLHIMKSVEKKDPHCEMRVWSLD
jgi:Holliday junction resolvase RusA-like endonuclease